MGAESIQRGLGTQKDSNIQIAILIRPNFGFLLSGLILFFTMDELTRDYCVHYSHTSCAPPRPETQSFPHAI